VPAGAGDGEKIHVTANVAQDFQGSMVLKQEVVVQRDSAYVLEHLGLLHIVGIRAKAVEAANGISVLSLSQSLADSTMTYMS
jgi:hypothetical protein